MSTADAGRMKELGKRLVLLRTRKAMSQKGLAQRAGISQAHLCRLEQGGRVPSFLVIEKLTHALGVPFEDVVHGRDLRPELLKEWLTENVRADFTKTLEVAVDIKREFLDKGVPIDEFKRMIKAFVAVQSAVTANTKRASERSGSPATRPVCV